MGKILVLAEKPSVGRDLARVLNCKQGGNGFLFGSKYIVTWALGHLVTLADPEIYDKKYKKWELETLPMLPERMQLVVIKESRKQFNVIRELMNRDDVDELVIATDAGREGELVARWIIMKAGWKKPVKRLWISSQTDRAIKEGFNNLRPAKEYDNLYKSAQCRAEADWLVGLNVTRALTCKYNAQLSAGRVQTPTLAMVVQRENEIKNFVSKDYWTIEAGVNGFSLHWRDKKGQTRIFDRARADETVSRIKGQVGKVVDVVKEARNEPPPLAYDLTELQREANRRYGYSAKKTLSIMQKLYEIYKLVTYPRTDSRYITEDIVPTLAERLRSIAVGPYSALVAALMKNKLNITRRFVDNSKVSDHHAIIPTEQNVNLSLLDKDERNVYDLIVKRFIAVLSRPFEYEQTTIKVEVAGEIFVAKGKIVKSQGWKAVYGGQAEEDHEDEEERDQVLPDVKKGAVLKLNSIKVVNRKTKPPARYTEATLLSAMEHPGKFIDDKALREVMDNGSGLGTPATRADIIEKLFDSFYMERNGKEIIPTSKGIQLINLVPEDLKSPKLTAKWEQQLSKISKGEVDERIFISEMKKYASKLVSDVIASTASYKHENITREKCPECGKFLLDVKGKKGRMLICQDRECGYRRGVSQISNARCPECHKKMEIRGEDENKTFYCVCGYREKLEAFKKRKQEQVSSREVRNFLKQQDEDIPINTALADALKKLKI
ncbi:DNA topoisomerase III [Acetivibrio straminisolvens]|jgi:DNA topoisomerase-3|uniref:DNA topoisomerase III n=1 Tax=Acetivibrio straminisolvens TaxID=253314 RepID=UPI00223F4CBB|nr:DNA topoisomerase III [Acetivibrio straminisolvens]